MTMTPSSPPMSDAPVVVTADLLRDWPVPAPDAAGGKDARGAVVVIGGAQHTPGAVLLAGVAALRVGAGKLIIATVEPNAPALAVTVPEAGVVALTAEPGGGLGISAVDDAADLLPDADGVLLGPGMAGPDDARELVSRLLPRLRGDATVVLDALGLTCGALDADIGHDLDGRAVITPNATEAALLLGEVDVPAGEDTARHLAERYGVVVALRSTVAAPDGRVWADHAGNSGLGTSGSGDVLAGIIAGLAARGASAEQAAVWGVHLHGAAGERLATRVGAVGYLARELLDELPRVLEQLTP
jgi:ADP-dependent NAD(P)H-hydrate dehydratase